MRLSERLLLALIIVTFLLPGFLTLLTYHANPAPWFDWIANRTLFGITVEKKVPPASLASWQSGELQKGLNTLASENFGGRELLIRAYDQILYEVFHKSYMYFEYIIRGKHGDLFERNYLIIHGGFMPTVPSEDAESLAVMMKYLSERLKELGSCFVFVITPNKATLYPEDIPDRFTDKIKSGTPKPTNYEILIPLLKRYGVPYVDGRAITLAHMDTLPVRAFPKSGTHWSRAAGYYTAAALLKMIGLESGRQMPPLSESVQSIDHQPDGADRDLMDLLNLVREPSQRYLHPDFRIPDNWPKRKGILAFIGGSFAGQLVSTLDAAQVFEQINYYYYFKISRMRYPGDIVTSVDENAIPWKEDFWDTRAVVLEANEYAIDGRHLRAFLLAALAALQQQMPRERGGADPPRPLSWGFGAGENGTALMKKGFSSPERQMTWMTGQDAEIELPSPGVDTKLQLILEAMPFLEGGVTMKTVKVEANGVPVGVVALADPEVQFYSLTINPSANSAPGLKLHFSFSAAPNPAPGSSKPRAIGLARLALVPLGRPIVQKTGEPDATAMTLQNP
jgi:alginate O-acetyltransferase complex protein AlgJ